MTEDREPFLPETLCPTCSPRALRMAEVLRHGLDYKPTGAPRLQAQFDWQNPGRDEDAALWYLGRLEILGAFQCLGKWIEAGILTDGADTIGEEILARRATAEQRGERP